MAFRAVDTLARQSPSPTSVDLGWDAFTAISGPFLIRAYQDIETVSALVASEQQRSSQLAAYLGEVGMSWEGLFNTLSSFAFMYKTAKQEVRAREQAKARIAHAELMRKQLAEKRKLKKQAGPAEEKLQPRPDLAVVLKGASRTTTDSFPTEELKLAKQVEPDWAKKGLRKTSRAQPTGPREEQAGQAPAWASVGLKKTGHSASKEEQPGTDGEIGLRTTSTVFHAGGHEPERETPEFAKMNLRRTIQDTRAPIATMKQGPEFVTMSLRPTRQVARGPQR